MSESIIDINFTRTLGFTPISTSFKCVNYVYISNSNTLESFRANPIAFHFNNTSSVRKNGRQLNHKNIKLQKTNSEVLAKNNNFAHFFYILNLKLYFFVMIVYVSHNIVYFYMQISCLSLIAL